MKILIVTPYLGFSYGGPSKVVREIVRELNNLGIEADIISTNADGKDCLDVPLNTWIKEANYRVKYFSCFHYNDLIFSHTLLYWLNHNLDNYDLIHTHTIFTPLISLVHQICQLKKNPYIATPHGMLETWALSHKAWKKKLYFALVEKKALSQATAIQALTSSEAQQLESLGFNNSIVIPNGVHAPEFETLASPEIFYQQFPETKSKILILFLARIHPKKGLDLLAPAFAKAYQRFPNVHLVVAGPDSSGFASTAKSYFIQAGCINAVTFTGMLTGTLKSSVLAASSIYVAPSYSEGFSMSVLEAMASGLPSIITTGCNFPEAAANNTAKVVGINEEQIGDALIELLESPLTSKKIGDRASKFIRENYTWDKIAVKMIDVYQKILDKR